MSVLRMRKTDILYIVAVIRGGRAGGLLLCMPCIAVLQITDVSSGVRMSSLRVIPFHEPFHRFSGRIHMVLLQ